MASITTLRPSSTTSGVGWSAVPSGSLDEVTSDDNDSTYALWSGAGSTMILATPLDSPPIGERRHLVRLRARGEDGSAWWAVRLASGPLVAGASATFPSSPGTVVGSWGAGAPADGPTVLSAYVTGQSSGVQINELYLDVDTREAPTFTPQILDGSGAVTTSISDTVTPTLRVNALDLDGLLARQYRFWVTQFGSTVWDTGIVSGAPINRATSPLANGSYTAHFQVWSTLGSNTPYPSAEQTLAFTITVGDVPAPEAPTVTEELPFYRIEVCAPDFTPFDDDLGYIEVQRVDCPHAGYLTLPGTSGSYASAPDLIDTTRYTFDATSQGWVGEGTTVVARVTTPVHDGAGSLRATKTLPGSGVGELRFNDGIVVDRDIYAAGPTLSAWVLVPTGAAGFGWTAHLELQSELGVWSAGTDFPLTPGTWARVTFSPSSALLANCRAIGVSVSGHDVGASQSVYIDTVVQGDAPFLLPPTDLQITVKAWRADDWRPATDQTLVAKYVTTGNHRSWRLALDADGGGDPALAGRPFLIWSANGTATITAAATERAPIDPTGAVSLRALLDVNNGAGGWTVTFQTLDETDTWIQLGAQISGVGTSAIFSSSEDFEVGAYQGGTLERFEGRIYSVEIRDGAAGDILADPDFSVWPAGTDTFTDEAGLLWTINGDAALTSSQTATSIVMFGPMVTDECAEWLDFTLPRSGMGRTCDHDPEPCCSYYRARSVGFLDGSLVVSNWSDAYNPGMPIGLIVMWPSTAASIPSGWSRVTALDGVYPKGLPAAVDPGATGGDPTHGHTTLGHVHDTSHLHTTTTPTGAANGNVTSTPNSAGTMASLATHTHTRPATNSATVASASAAPGTGTVANDVDRLEVLYIESDGTDAGAPASALGLMPDISPPGWDTYTNGTNRFLKGATGSSGGAQAANTMTGHTHSVTAHTHAGTAHIHSSSATGNFTATNTLNSGPNTAMWVNQHNHPITVNSSSSQSLASGGSGTSGAAVGTLEPPYRNLRLRQNTLGFSDLPVGLICIWRRPLNTVPANWQLCDGSNGTPNMESLYPRAATASINGTGGSSATHTHTGPSTHNHSTTGHAHSSTTGAGTGTTVVSATATVTVASGAHTHPLVDTASTTPTVGSTAAGTLQSQGTDPFHEEVAFVQLMEIPEPPPTPPVFCLEWSDQEHLIRTMGPDGPMWVPVLGKFEWDVDRPFTAAAGVNGGRFVTSAPPGGRNLHMTAAVESEAALAEMHAVLSRPLVLISPSDASEVWAAPVAESVRIIKIGRIRSITADFIGTGPEPAPQLADVTSS